MTSRLFVVCILCAAYWCSGCSRVRPAEAPSAIQAATAALNLTDAALAVAIEQSEDTPMVTAVWESRVSLLENAASLLRSSGQACAALPDIVSVASAVSCEPCITAVRAAEEQLQCRK